MSEINKLEKECFRATKQFNKKEIEKDDALHHFFNYFGHIRNMGIFNISYDLEIYNKILKHYDKILYNED